MLTIYIISIFLGFLSTLAICIDNKGGFYHIKDIYDATWGDVIISTLIALIPIVNIGMSLLGILYISIKLIVESDWVHKQPFKKKK